MNADDSNSIQMTAPQTAAQLKGLRDFFSAANATELAHAYAYLADWVSEPAPDVADWQTVEFAFNRLFVGPRAPIAPPFASVYLEAEPQLMGQSTLKVRRIYELIGLQSPAQNVIPDDHISYELDAVRQLTVAQISPPSAELAATRDYFLTEHMSRWLPQFVDRVRADQALPEAVGFVIDRLEDWLTRELSSISVLSD